jgi:hypothetical protein
MTANLGNVLSQFTILAGTGVSNVSPDTTITGDVGTAGGSYSGLVSTQVDGTFHPINDTTTQQAMTQFNVAYGIISNLPITNPGAWPSGYDLTGNTLGAGINTLGPGVYRFGGDANLAGTLTLDADFDTNAVFVFKIEDDLNIIANSAIVLANGANSCNVYWIVGDSVNMGEGSEFIGNILANNSINLAGGNIIIGRLLSRNGSVTFTGNPSLIANVCICFARGTNILTSKGYVPIENIRIGDEIVTCGDIPEGYTPTKLSRAKTQRVKWVGYFTATNLNKKTHPIRIKKNAFSRNSPQVDVLVSPDHGLHVDGKFFSAKNLVNGTTIYQDTTFNSIDYFHIEVEDHSIVVADGLYAESFLDSNKYIRKTSFVSEALQNHEPNRLVF